MKINLDIKGINEDKHFIPSITEKKSMLRNLDGVKVKVIMTKTTVTEYPDGQIFVKSQSWVQGNFAKKKVQKKNVVDKPKKEGEIEL